jgi:hypothetical protein
MRVSPNASRTKHHSSNFSVRSLQPVPVIGVGPRNACDDKIRRQESEKRQRTTVVPGLPDLTSMESPSVTISTIPSPLPRGDVASPGISGRAGRVRDVADKTVNSRLLKPTVTPTTTSPPPPCSSALVTSSLTASAASSTRSSSRPNERAAPRTMPRASASCDAPRTTSSLLTES